MLEPEVEARPWDEQLALDDESYRAQLRYLLERSPFYRAKLAGADPGGGLAELATLPLTEKDELRASRTRENPIGEHLCAERSELVRISSTSGTTGTPSSTLNFSMLILSLLRSARSNMVKAMTIGWPVSINCIARYRLRTRFVASTTTMITSASTFD